jgi:membrane protein
MLKELITVPTENLGKWSRFAVLQLRIWRQCFKLLMQNRSRTVAAALSYHTVFGIVPLAIVTVMVFQIFPAYRGIGDRVREFAYEQLHLTKIEYPLAETDTEVEKKSVTIAEKLDELTESYISKLNRGAITFISAIIVIWAAVGLLTTIERAFNNIWRVGRGRSFLNRMINYWALLTLAPLLLGAGFYVSTQYLVSGFQLGGMGYVRPILPYMISLIAFFFLYFVMPNTKVSPSAALWGAAVAALLWTAAKYGFRMYVTNVIPYQAVYGILGIIPLAVFWIYITWLIVLFGLQLTYATQHVKTLDAAELAMTRRSDERFLANDISAFKVMGCVLEAFEKKDEQPVSVGDVCTALDIPDELGEKILDHFVRAGLLCQTDEPKVGYVPSTEGDNITLADVHDALSRASFAQGDEGSTAKLKEIVAEMREQLDEHTLKEILKQDVTPASKQLQVDEDQTPPTKQVELPEKSSFPLQ